MAFLHALHSYDEKKEASFRTFASVCIRNHIYSILQSGKKAKNFALADEIRNELLEKGIILEDTREGVKWKKA